MNYAREGKKIPTGHKSRKPNLKKLDANLKSCLLLKVEDLEYFGRIMKNSKYRILQNIVQRKVDDQIYWIIEEEEVIATQ